MTSRTLRLLAVLFAGALFLGACGDDDDAADTDETTTSTTEADESTVGTDDDDGTDDDGTDGTDDDGTDDDGTDGTDAGSTGGGTGGFDPAILSSVDDFCALDDVGDDAFDSVFDPDSEDPAERKAAFEMLGAFYLRAIEIAPDEIRADVETTVSAFEPLFALIERYDYDGNAVFEAAQNDPELAAQLDALNSPEMEAASDRVDDWIDANCD